MTTMIRFRRVAQIWDWLPAFRGVAEHESLQRAAAALAVSPSALSRTIKLLEDALGAPLFERHPGGLRPTSLGDELLAITRDAMRLVDDCLAAHEARAGRVRPLVVGAASEIAMIVAARALPSEAMPLELRRTTDDAIEEQLLQGNLDVVVTTAPPASPPAPLVVDVAGAIRRGLYASTAVDVAEARYVTSDRTSVPADKVAFYTESIEAARVAAEQSGLVAVLPDVVAGASLVRLGDAGEALALSVVWRKPAAPGKESPQIDAILRGLRAALR